MRHRLGTNDTNITRGLITALLASIAVWGCTDSSTPNGETSRAPSDVSVLTLDSTAPALEVDSASFYAVVDQKRSVDIYFDSAGVRVDRVLHFEVDKKSLYRRPDGSRFRQGDSILITVRVTDPQSLQFDFEPAGLKFDSSEPAVLTIGYSRALTAANAFSPVFRNPARGSHGGRDETDLAIWLQEDAASLFFRLDTRVDVQDREVEADIPGFSKYAVAY